MNELINYYNYYCSGFFIANITIQNSFGNEGLWVTMESGEIAMNYMSERQGMAIKTSL